MKDAAVLLIIGKVWPEPQSSAAGWRMLQLIAAFQDLQYTIHFGSTARKGSYSADLSQLGIKEITLQLNDSSFDAYIKALQPDIVLFDRFTSEEQFGWRIREQCPDTLHVLDTEDLHGLREARQRVFKEKRELTNSDLQSALMLRELSSIHRCDLSLIISPFEKQLLEEVLQVPPYTLHYLPLLTDLKEPKTPAFEERQHFISIGNFLHAPNLDAVGYLYTEIWPSIRKELPKAELLVYGPYANEQVNQWHQPGKGFKIMGRAEDAAAVMEKARICLAPLRFGAGQKGKLLLAMECGTPSITTPIGSEGMEMGLPWPGKIAEQAEEFSQAAITLYQDAALWNTANKAAKLLLPAYERSTHLITFKSRITQLKTDYQKDRQRNFTRALLLQNERQTTRYMSLWIETKNKLASD